MIFSESVEKTRLDKTWNITENIHSNNNIKEI